MTAFPWGCLSLSFLVALAATPLVRWAALRWGLLDRPKERSSHVRPTPRGGGLAVIGAAGLSLAAAGVSWDREALVFLAGAAAMGLIGLCDDRFDLPPLPRLLAQTGVALAVVLSCGGLTRMPLPDPLGFELGPIAPLAGVLWIVAVLNFYNFLDGVDGLAGLQGAITGLGVALACWDAFAVAFAAGVVGGCLGFLVFNWSPARIFLGDVGSTFLGYTFATLPLLAPETSRGGSVLVVALSLWLFLSDATWTLLSRMLRGERWYAPHREHLYQRLVRAGWSHARVATVIGAGSALLTAVALAPEALGGWPSLGLAGTLFLTELGLAGWREARS